MAKKKQSQQMLSPIEFLKKKIRLVPLYKCYKTVDMDKCGEGNVVVVRRHLNNKYSFGVYLVDKFCCGVKDSFYKLHTTEADLELVLSRLEFTEIDYVEAHNLIYGAIEWAEEAGISPDSSFNLSKYILEEDTDDIPVMDIEFGHKGKYLLFCTNQSDFRKYSAILTRNGIDFEHVYPIDPNEDL